jgi:hypothetical protein
MGSILGLAQIWAERLNLVPKMGSNLSPKAQSYNKINNKIKLEPKGPIKAI